jgi:DNA-binding MarR family transcriptional regulator
MEIPTDTRELIILDQIKENPDVNQATMADQLGVAVGTANLVIKNLVEKGAIKVKRAQRKKLRYIITPEGLALRARLTVDYIENSMRLYRRTRQRVIDALAKVQAAGYDCVHIVGEGDIAEVIRLTCIEQGFQIENDLKFPALEVQGWKVHLNMEAE